MNSNSQCHEVRTRSSATAKKQRVSCPHRGRREGGWPSSPLPLHSPLACSLILSRLDYSNAVLHGAPAGSIQKLQRVQNTAARVVLQVPRRSSALPLLEQLHWLPVRQRIDYKLAVLTYKTRSTSTPSYLSRHIRPRESARHLRSSTAPLLYKPVTRTRFADRAFRCTAPTVWNSLATDIYLLSLSPSLPVASLPSFPFPAAHEV